MLNDHQLVAIGVLIPLAGTALGAGFVFFLKGEMKPALQKVMLGFASGVMIAASVWSLLIPSLEMAQEQGVIPWLPAAVGFLLGMGFLLALDCCVPHLHVNSEEPEGLDSELKKSTMLVLAVTLHNIPEGMAVGVVFAGFLNQDIHLSAASAFALALGIALQNVPEGAIISVPLANQGLGKKKAFGLGLLSGAVEPVGSLITILLTGLILPFLPYFLSFAAGAMLYVVVEELIPEAQFGPHSNIGTISTAIGFVVMMVLDVALG